MREKPAAWLSPPSAAGQPCPHGARTHGGRRTAAGSENDLIDVAPPPVLSGFDGLDERMPRGVKMLGCVAVLRVIATADMSACQAQSKVHPPVAGLQTLLAALSRRSHLAHLIQMPA